MATDQLALSGVRLEKEYWTKGGISYRVKSGTSRSYASRVFWLEGSKKNDHTGEGPRHHMSMLATQLNHKFLVAFDHMTLNKLFASYVDPRNAWDALLCPDDHHRARPSRVPLTAYEMIPNNRPCKVHFDVEWDPKEHLQGIDSREVLTSLANSIVAAMRELWPFATTTLRAEDFLFSRARDMTNKISYHMVLGAPLAFENNDVHHKAFVNYLCRRWARQLVSANSRDDPVARDIARYFVPERIMKATAGAEERPATHGVMIIDHMIYTQFRQFRLLFSTKQKAAERVLLPYDPFNDVVLAQPEAHQFEMWRRYLITDVDPAVVGGGLSLLRCPTHVLDMVKPSVIAPLQVRSPELVALKVYFTSGVLDRVARQLLEERRTEGKPVKVALAVASRPLAMKRPETSLLDDYSTQLPLEAPGGGGVGDDDDAGSYHRHKRQASLFGSSDSLSSSFSNGGSDSSTSRPNSMDGLNESQLCLLNGLAASLGRRK